MGTTGGKWDDEEYSYIPDKGEIGFIDYQDDKSVCSYNPEEEGPVVVSALFPLLNGKPQSVVVGEVIADSITLKNTTGEAVDLWAKIYASNPENSFTLSLMKPPDQNLDATASQDFLEFFALDDRMLQPGETLTIWVSCKPQDLGLHTTVLQFDMDSERIERTIFLLAEDKISKSLTSKRPYARAQKKKSFVVDTFVEGSRPAKVFDRTYRNKLLRYEIPKDIRELLENGGVPVALGEGLTRDNYGSYFKTLLTLEEIQLEEDMKTYHMENITMRKKRAFLSLEVPGLAEKRPSLVHGDNIFAQFSDKDDSCPNSVFKGYVHRVEADEVHLKFAYEFHFQHVDSNRYNIYFTYNRINVRRLYQAIDAAKALDREFLFPSDSIEKRIIDTDPLTPLSCALNEEQVSAIKMILGCKGAPPYVIHGPPGTGKTMTVVEAILQLYKTRKNARILVCAPSNSAADHILEKLLNESAVEIRENEIFRLNATTRPYEDMKPEFIRFCFFDDLVFKCPPLRALTRYKIIISTYMSASFLYAEGVKRGHFSHIFLDEAGQASEPESMIPISNLCVKKTVVVLAGDPMQLGPVILSKQAVHYGMAVSYLERMFECEHYLAANENYVTKLVRNYRCHPEILSLPSKLFYRGELIACKEDTSSLLTTLNFLPNKEFPVLFYGIQGLDEREGNNPSWFNRVEVSKVVEVIRKLTESGSVEEHSIGVITPYKQQVNKLKEVLESLDMTGIKVGSVEQFQGQEKQVIVVSTVRSTIIHNNFDRAHCLGFLSNSRRFNVAITRAISLLVIIGNPHIICQDSYWNQLLWRCADNNSYQGCPLPDRKKEYNNEGRAEEGPHRYDDQPSAKGDWGQQDESWKPSAEGDWGQGESWKPSAEGDWGQGESWKPSAEGDWGQGESWKPSAEGEWGQEGSYNYDPLQPIKDEAEWSDGWKD